jgi:branched-subunit amino acid transport protein AzlD
MSTRAASLIATILSILLLVIFAVLAAIFTLIALNGANESQGMQAIGISLACLGAGGILLGMLAWKGTELLITKFGLNPVLAITLIVALALLTGGALSILSIFISIPLAGVR